MPFVPAGAMAIAAAGTTAATAYMGYQSNKAQGEQQEALAEYNAQLKDNEAKQQRTVGAIKAAEIRKRTRRLISSQRATYGKSGVTTAGTPLLKMMETAEVGELDALTAEYNAGIDAERSISDAATYRTQGKSARQAGSMRAGQSLLGGVSNIAGIGLNYYKKA